MLQEEVMNALFTRTSVRAYQNDALKPEEIRRILQAGFCAPSARDARPWYFIVIQENGNVGVHLDKDTTPIPR